MGPDLESRLRGATTWWSLARVLVEAWRARADPTGAPWHGHDDEYDRYGQLMVDLERRLGPVQPAGPTLEQIELVQSTVDRPETWRLAAAIDAIDRRCHPVFCADWVAEHPAPFTPAAGELYPVPGWEGPQGWAYSRNPTNLARRPDEFPHIRAYEPTLGYTDPVEITFDCTAEIELTAALTDLTVLATVHPNDAWHELTMSPGPTAFPVGPNPDDQLDRLKTTITTALRHDAQLIVLPELCVTETILEELRDWFIAQQSFSVAVLGSHHTLLDGEPANLSETCVGATILPHRKMSRSPTKLPACSRRAKGSSLGPGGSGCSSAPATDSPPSSARTSSTPTCDTRSPERASTSSPSPP